MPFRPPALNFLPAYTAYCKSVQAYVSAYSSAQHRLAPFSTGWMALASNDCLQALSDKIDTILTQRGVCSNDQGQYYNGQGEADVDDDGDF